LPKAASAVMTKNILAGINSKFSLAIGIEVYKNAIKMLVIFLTEEA
jgi:hypothetical protein